MTKEKEEKFVIALDLGSSQARMGIAGFNPNDKSKTLTIYNTVSVPSVDSVRYGCIKNIREVTEIVNDLLEGLEGKYPIEGRNITGLFLTLGGRSLKSHKISARKVLPERREITEEIITELKDEAIEGSSFQGDLICVEPVRFLVDNMTAPRPVGSLGSRLAGTFTAVECNPANKTDLVDVVADRVGLGIAGLSVRPVALARLVLSPQETKSGCMLVDFGAETTTVSIYKNYALQYLATIPIGSRLITRDLAQILSLTEEEAETAKINFSDAMPERDRTYENPEFRETLNAVVVARLADIVANIAAQPQFAEISPEKLPFGIVLVGGGSKMRNFARLLESQTNMKVRLATLPSEIIINDSNMGGIDNLALIATLFDGAEELRQNPEFEFVTNVKEPAPKERASETVIDFTEPSVSTTQNDKWEEDSPFHTAEPFNDEFPYNYSDEFDGDELTFDSEEDEERNRQQQYDRQRKANDNAKRQAIKEAKKAVRERKRREREEYRKNHPSFFNKIKIISVKLLGSPGEDESGNMD